MRVVIIGGNAAGMSAASRVKRKAPEHAVTVLEATQELSYGACGLPYYIAGLNDDLDLMRIRKKPEFEKSGIQARTGHRVTEVDFAKRLVQGEVGGKPFETAYDKLVIASGASPIIPPIAGAELDGVFVLRTLDHARRIRAAVEKKGDVVVVGGGYVGLEIAEACLLQGVRSVRVIEAADRLLNAFDPEFGQAAKEALEQHGAAVHTGEQVRSLEGADGAVRGVVTDKGSYPADTVILSVGVRPNTAFAKGLELLPNGAIIVDEAMQTSLPDVYAAGDCATVQHKLLDRPVYLPLGTNANKQGRLVGDAVRGKPVGLVRALGTSMLRCMDLELAKTGLGEAECAAAGIACKSATVKARTHARYYPDPYDITIKVCYRPDDKVLLGAQLMGEKECVWRIDVFACAIDQGMTTEELGYLDLGYSPPFSTVWDAVQVAANASK